ncbi:MAG: hypothetical protein PHS38_14400 [Bacteroidales bacterium]|nr:hypothetical protein [Bacteroidales bacterium]
MSLKRIDIHVLAIDRSGHEFFIQKLKCFVKGMIEDREVIEVSILYTDNNGITEENVTRLKNIKRKMYGRAGFDLPLRKVVLSNSG